MKYKCAFFIFVALSMFVATTLLLCRLHAISRRHYVVECIFANGSPEMIVTNSLGQIVQPCDYSGSIMDVATGFMRDFKSDWRRNIVEETVMSEHAAYSNRLDAVKTAIHGASVELVGRPVLVFNIKVRSRYREVAMAVADAYVRQIREHGGLSGNEGEFKLLSRLERDAREFALAASKAEAEMHALSAKGIQVQPALEIDLSLARAKHEETVQVIRGIISKRDEAGGLIRQIGTMCCHEEE